MGPTEEAAVTDTAPPPTNPVTHPTAAPPTNPVTQWAAPRHVVLALLEHLRKGTTALMDDVMVLDSAIFSDPAIARLENDAVFGTVPFVAAHSSELADPGAFLTKRLPRNEAVLARGTDGTVRAFVNQCRHRGALVVPEAAGHCRRFTCPYHGWSYDTDGTLRAITFPASFGAVDTTTLGLVSLPAEERHGFIWVVDEPAATIDVAAWLGPETDAQLGAFGLEHLQCFRARAFEEPVNWKVMYDAFLDGYHIKFAHPNSAGRMVHTNTYVVEDHGRHSRFSSPRKSLDAWRDHDPAPDEAMLSHVMMAHRLGPNATLLQLEDNFQLLTFAPVSDAPDRSVMEMRLLVPPVHLTDSDPDAWREKWDKNWHILQVVLAGEDFPILRDLQRAYASRSAQSTVLGRNEVNNQAFHREIAALRDSWLAGRSDPSAR
jgi:phenylpropionate dioxygenase-like ring-hydroxylating dioxygenase large terminal subunit